MQLDEQDISSNQKVVLSPKSLSKDQARGLKALAHHLRPVVQIGQNGMTEGVVEATKVALEQHELIKVSINSESPTERREGGAELAEHTGAHLLQVIGRVIILYRQREHDSKITPPKSKSRKK